MDPQPANPTPVPPPAPEASTPAIPTSQTTPPVPTAPTSPTTPPAPAPTSAAPVKYIIAGLTIITILLLFTVGFLYYQKMQSGKTKVPATTPTPQATMQGVSVPPSSPTNAPTVPPDWKTYQFDSIKMTLQAPPNLQVIEDSQGSTTAVSIYIQNYGLNSPPPTTNPYQLYIIYQWEPPTTEAQLEAKKEELEPSTIQEVTIDGYRGFRGQIKGERNRYVTYFLKNSALFSGFTSEPTKENEALSNQIISTIDFKDN